MSSPPHQTIGGHCACGALRYSINVDNVEHDLQLATFCHCSGCQRLNGAPYIWSTHWLYRAVQWFPSPSGPPPGADDLPSDVEGTFSSEMQVYELMKGRKWKLRCRQCGSPMGSWNAGKQKWTIWPTTLKRRASPTQNTDEVGVKAEGDFDVPKELFQRLRPSHHQFYGPWRSVTLHDGLPKWLGYDGQSQRVDDEGKSID